MARSIKERYAGYPKKTGAGFNESELKQNTISGERESNHRWMSIGASTETVNETCSQLLNEHVSEELPTTMSDTDSLRTKCMVFHSLKGRDAFRSSIYTILDALNYEHNHRRDAPPCCR